jgi:hypothetical protein
MKKFFFILMTIALASSAYSQSALPKGLKVNGIALDASYADIVKKLGKPTRDVTAKKINECIGERLRTLYYPGLQIEMVESERGKFTMYAFTVTSAKWDVSGNHVGDTAGKIQKLYGTRGRTVQKDRGADDWTYEMDPDSPGSSTFTVKNGKVTEISSTYMMC